jgi:membrane protease YdiL (CAAX protease family)
MLIIPLGFIFAYWFARTGRLWPVILAHAIFDFIGLNAYVGL